MKEKGERKDTSNNSSKVCSDSFNNESEININLKMEKRKWRNLMIKMAIKMMMKMKIIMINKHYAYDKADDDDIMIEKRQMMIT